MCDVVMIVNDYGERRQLFPVVAFDRDTTVVAVDRRTPLRERFRAMCDALDGRQPQSLRVVVLAVAPVNCRQGIHAPRDMIIGPDGVLGGRCPDCDHVELIDEPLQVIPEVVA